MGISEQKRQKKLMKQRRKQKEKRKAQAAASQWTPFASLSRRKKILQANSFPIHECLVNPSWRERGFAQILLTRRQPDGNLAFGCYLVDTYCLGLKNTFCNADIPVSEYDLKIRSQMFREEPSEACPPALAHEIIYGGIDYAARFGFKPNRDFETSQHILDGRDAVGPGGQVEFGYDGKPLFVAGPEDNVNWILKQLDATAGKGGYDYICPVLGKDEDRPADFSE